MLALLVSMIILSLVVGSNINGDFEYLYTYEFKTSISMMKQGTLPAFEVATWLFLVISHIVILALPLLMIRKSKYFNLLLWIAPPSFMLFFYLSDSLLLVLLIPFAIAWIASLIFMPGNRSLEDDGYDYVEMRKKKIHN